MYQHHKEMKMKMDCIVMGPEVGVPLNQKVDEMRWETVGHVGMFAT